MSRNAETLKQLFLDLEHLDFAAVAAHCASDCIYEDVPYFDAARAIGPEAISAKLEMGMKTLERLPTTIHELLETAFGLAGIEDWQSYVKQDPRFYRPAEVDLLIGDASKARKVLGW